MINDTNSVFKFDFQLAIYITSEMWPRAYTQVNERVAAWQRAVDDCVHVCAEAAVRDCETSVDERSNTKNRRRHQLRTSLSNYHVIYSYTNDMPYINALYCASIPSVVDRREQLSRKFFTSILQPSSCLHTLLPTARDPIITTRLRSANKFPRLPSRTRKYQTFIS